MDMKMKDCGAQGWSGLDCTWKTLGDLISRLYLQVISILLKENDMVSCKEKHSNVKSRTGGYFFVSSTLVKLLIL